MLPALTWAALCDETYYLNSVSQTIHSGDNPTALTVSARSTVKPNLSDLTILDSNVAYNVITRFEGSCAKAVKPITLKSKPAGNHPFKDSVDNTYSVQMFDTNTKVDEFEYDYWFGFFKPAGALKFALGRYNAKSEMFVNWYVGVVWRDSVRDANSGIWAPATTHFYPLVGPDDSAVLQERMVDATIGQETVDANHKGRYTVQFLKVSYDSKQPTRVLTRNRPASSGFQANQTGDLVLIRPNVSASGTGEALSLYGMMGNKVATLHPTGYAYQWNGRTFAGANAPTGVYFVQSGNRILGKFFYTR